MPNINVGKSFQARSISRQKGFSIFELIFSLPVLLAVSFFSVDALAVAFGADYCDKACQDCARAAGAMSTPDDAVNAMNAACKPYISDSRFFSQLYPELLIYEDYNQSTSKPTPPYGTTRSYGGKNGPENVTPELDPISQAKLKPEDPLTNQIGPHLVVRTTLIMKIPITIAPYGAKLFFGNAGTDLQQFKFQSTYTFPIINTFTPS